MGDDPVVAGYDAVADAYAARFVDELSVKPDDRALLDRLAGTTSGVVCDLGCGPAHVGAYLARAGASVVGLDRSPGIIAEARRASPEIPVLLGDARALPFGDGRLGGVVAFYSLIHLERAELPGGFREIARVLRPGGLVLVAMHGGAGTGTDRFLDRPIPMSATLVELDELTGFVRAAGLHVRQAREREPYASEHPTPRLYVEASRVRATVRYSTG